MNPEVEAARLARVALSWLVEPGSRALWLRVAEHGPARVLDGLLATGRDHLLRRAVGARLDTTDPRAAAAATLARTRRLGARVVIPEDDEWPGQLDQLVTICRDGRDPIDRDAAPPLCLWVRGPGRLDEVLRRSVAVVGARAATGYGAHAARQVGYELADRGWTVVSGGAYGVDAHAHRGALAAGGLTVVVLACGVDRAYPTSHANLFERVSEDGLLVSEWPPGAEPFRHRFLIRNRVIAAATSGTVVVEAGARSGALQTLRRAGELGRCRMVMPGPITSAMSVGCHEQLRDPEVRLVTGAPHILEEVGKLSHDLAPVVRGPVHPRDGLEPAERRLLEALLIRKPLSSEAAAVRAGVPAGEAMRILPSLVVRGFARRSGHGFVIVREPSADEAGRAPGAAPAGAPA
ncbi:MAG: DNA-protecting protein DprA [Micromonosporaceae bacterium]|nr:DNA-protecting protein DprA [Micromonosporaceae bacterium]